MAKARFRFLTPCFPFRKSSPSRSKQRREQSQVFCSCLRQGQDNIESLNMVNHTETVKFRVRWSEAFSSRFVQFVFLFVAFVVPFHQLGSVSALTPPSPSTTVSPSEIPSLKEDHEVVASAELPPNPVEPARTQKSSAQATSAAKQAKHPSSTLHLTDEKLVDQEDVVAARTKDILYRLGKMAPEFTDAVAANNEAADALDAMADQKKPSAQSQSTVPNLEKTIEDAATESAEQSFFLETGEPKITYPTGEKEAPSSPSHDEQQRDAGHAALIVNSPPDGGKQLQAASPPTGPLTEDSLPAVAAPPEANFIQISSLPHYNSKTVVDLDADDSTLGQVEEQQSTEFHESPASQLQLEEDPNLQDTHENDDKRLSDGAVESQITTPTTTAPPSFESPVDAGAEAPAPPTASDEEADEQQPSAMVELAEKQQNAKLDKLIELYKVKRGKFLELEDEFKSSNLDPSRMMEQETRMRELGNELESMEMALNYGVKQLEASVNNEATVEKKKFGQLKDKMGELLKKFTELRTRVATRFGQRFEHREEMTWEHGKKLLELLTQITESWEKAREQSNLAKDKYDNLRCPDDQEQHAARCAGRRAGHHARSASGRERAVYNGFLPPNRRSRRHKSQRGTEQCEAESGRTAERNRPPPKDRTGSGTRRSVMVVLALVVELIIIGRDVVRSRLHRKATAHVAARTTELREKCHRRRTPLILPRFWIMHANLLQ
ncbi:unnamed protein product [Amoebophrya sp. A120]|nr:unnamed protein product [Amoebophrya sp. A120]|eukprot:GSA120T00018463001.1